MRIALLASLLLSCSIAPGAPRAEKPFFAKATEGKPNVVILFTDDQGTLDAGCYGSTDLQTPAMDRLAGGCNGSG